MPSTSTETVHSTKTVHALAILTLFGSLVLTCQNRGQAQVKRGQQSQQLSKTKSRQINRLTFPQLREMAIELTGRKITSVGDVQDSSVPRLLNVDFNSKYNWHGNIGMAANNDNIIYLIFPCRKIDAKDNREEYIQRLLFENRKLGLMRFEIDRQDMVKLVYPLVNNDLTAEKLNHSVRSLLVTAASTAGTWSNQPSSNTTGTSKPDQSHLRPAIPMSGSAPPAGPDAQPGTLPTKGSSPSAGTVPQRTGRAGGKQ